MKRRKRPKPFDQMTDAEEERLFARLGVMLTALLPAGCQNVLLVIDPEGDSRTVTNVPDDWWLVKQLRTAAAQIEKKLIESN